MGLIRKLFGRQSEPDLDDGPFRISPVSTVETASLRPFDTIQEANAAFAQGDRVIAEQLFRRAVDAYRATTERDGIAYALGRLGDFYQTTGRSAEAIRAYEEAVGLDTDIPAIFHGLMSLYADRGDEDRTFQLADRFLQKAPRHAENIARNLTSMGTARVELDSTANAERWLLRTEGWSLRSGNPAIRFAAWGQRGLVVERSKDLTRAVSIYEAAVIAGSTDRVTYTRLLMAREREKRWSDLLDLTQRALGIQSDAAWEVDLRKRVARAESKMSPAVGSSQVTQIAMFSVRLGDDRLQLITQATIKYGASKVAISPDGKTFLVSAGSAKPDNITLLDVSTNTAIWSKSAIGSSADVLALGPDGFLIASDVGRIGDGQTELLFTARDGRTVATMMLPDKLSEIGTAGNLVAVGCRNGYLYAFDRTGREQWRFLVPAPKHPQDALFGGVSCPYFVLVAPDGGQVMFSSWNTIFMLNAKGQTIWTWEALTRSNRIRFTSGSNLNDSYAVLGLSSTASKDDVRRAFFRRALETHPDLHPDNSRANAAFREAVQAYEAITSSAGPGGGTESVGLEVSLVGGTSTVYGLAMSLGGKDSLVTTSDGVLTRLDARGRATEQVIVNEGAGFLAATADLKHVVYAHWKGLNFYASGHLVDMRPAESLHHLRMASDGHYIVAWTGKELRVFTTEGQSVFEIQCARTVTDVIFASPTELIVAAGKIIRLSILDKKQLVG